MRRVSDRSRRGISSLELVMALPILLMVMALMINFGTVASWKIRGLSLARNELWSHRERHQGDAYFPPQYRPRYWPLPQYQLDWPTGVSQSTGGRSVTSLNGIEQNDGAYLPVARGPVVGDDVPPPGQPFIVNDLLDPARSLREGNSTVARAFPMLQRLGSYTGHAATQAVDGPWTFSGLGVVGNNGFRAPLLYTVPMTVDPNYALNYINAVARIYYASFAADLQPLDNDDEFRKWKQRFPLDRRIRGWGYNFIRQYAWMSSFCDADDDTVQRLVDNLIDRIQGTNGQKGIAENMRRDFHDFFNDVVTALQNELNAVPPPPPDVQAQIQQDIQTLQAEIALLQTALN